MPRISRPAAYGVAALFAAALYLFFARAFHVDFVAFWCAGSVLRHHGNPYLDGPLHACETSAGLIAPLTVPVPYPPYVMAVFWLLSLLPQQAAFVLWSALLVAATLATARALERLAGVSYWLALPAALAAILIPNLEFGQLAPLALVCFTWALVYLRDQRYWAAGAAMAGMALLPNLAAPAWIAALLCVPKARLALVTAGAALVALALACMGLSQNELYVFGVLPAHAASELATPEQFGLTVILRAVGLSAAQSVDLAYAGFLMAIALGIACGVGLRRRYGGDQWVAAAAAAIGLAGSPFLHDHDIGFTLPLVFMLVGAVPSLLTRAALVLLVAPWLYVFVSPRLTDAAVALVLLLPVVAAMTPRQPVAFAAVVLAMAAFYLAVHGSDLPNRRLDAIARISAQPSPPPDALAEVRWTRFNDAVQDPPAIWLERAPIYAGLFLMVLSALNESRRAEAR